MLCEGPWAHSIVAFERSTSAAFEQYFAAAGKHSDRPEQQFGRLPTLSGEGRSALVSARRPDGALGVLVDGHIQAVALYGLCGTASSSHVMRLLIGVAEDHRRKGMGSALLMRCTAMARQAGLRYVVIEDIDAGLLHLAHLASADLVFCNGECQGWIELGPLPPAAARPEFADAWQA